MKGDDRGVSNSRNVFAKMIIIICMIIFIISSCFLFKDFLDYKEANNSIDELLKDVMEENTDEEILSIDWKSLKEINEDIIGWIKIENTNINYPILKNKELYYLKHSFNKKYNTNGSLFTMNSNPFKEIETTIYGHNMRNGIMFSELSEYLNEEFFYTHINFEIYTQEQNYTATVFSSYSIGVNIEENNIKLLDFDEEIEYYKNASKYSVPDIGNVKKIVKLSTCSYLNNREIPTNQRYYIVAKLENIN